MTIFTYRFMSDSDGNRGREMKRHTDIHTHTLMQSL